MSPEGTAPEEAAGEGAPGLSLLGQMGAVRRDPVLRMACWGLLLFGSWTASVGVHQSMLAAEVFGLGDGGISLLLALSLVVAVAGSLAVGILTDQRPVRRLMATAAAAAMALGPALVWLWPREEVFAVAHVVLMPLGATIFGQLFAAARMALGRHPEPERDRLLAAVRAVFAVPFVVVLPLWGLAFGLGAPLLAIYPVTAALGLLTVALARLSWPPDAHWGQAPSGLGLAASLGEVAAPGVLGRVALVGGLQVGAALNGVLLGLCFAAGGRGAGDTGLFFGAFVAIEIAVTLRLGPVLRRLGRLPTIALGVAVYAGYLALLPLLAAGPWVWALVIPAAAGGALIYAPSLAYLQDLLADRPGAGSSLTALQRVSQDGLGAGLFAAGTAMQGYAAVAALGAGATVLAVAALIRLDARAAPRP